MELKFRVEGMTCAACSARVEKVASGVNGVQKAEVNLLAGKLTVIAEDKSVTDDIIRAVTDAGYTIPMNAGKEESAPKDNHMAEMKRRIIISAGFLIVLMYFTMGHMIGLPVPSWYHGAENAVVAALLQFMLTLPVVGLNWTYFTKGAKALWHRSPNMDSLIAVGSGASLVYGIFVLFRMAYSLGQSDMEALSSYRENLYFESAAMILTLITLGKFLEARAKGKTTDAIRKLMDLRPQTATLLLPDGTEKTVAIDAVKAGDVVVVRSGGSIPVDGVVLSGHGAVDQSALTGESVPVDVSEGDKVSAATINTQGYLTIRAEQVGQDTTLAGIIRLVEEAGGSKAPIARLADRIAGVFVPVVMGIALITFCVWLIAGQSFEFALSAGISVLVISCPCALGLATPVAIMVGTGRGAQLGVLYKNAQVLEELHKVSSVVMDKTGTLTTGRPEVTDIFPAQVGKDSLCAVAAGLEAQSEHPFAKAILSYCDGITIPKVDEFCTLPGMGVSGIINGKRYFGGNRRLMDSQGVVVPERDVTVSNGGTPLFFGCEDGTYLGSIVAADVLKSDAKHAVTRLKKMGLDVIMLTGDNAATAAVIADSAGVAKFISDVLPSDKAGEIKKLQASGKRILMVGDGINDAPALVTADVGMAIGAGTDIAMESADIVLMRSDLESICDAIELSRATIRNIRQNLFWAFFYNTLGIPLAAGVLYPAFGLLLSPMIGAAAMSMSSVFVVTNALRLRFFKPKSNTNNEVESTVKENVNMEIIIKVEGMMCPHCKARVESVCKAVSGATDAIVDLQEKQVTVTGNPSVEALKKAITDAGYEVIG